MAKRKPTDMAQMNLRLPEKLRKMIEVEAKKNDWSLNRELVRRLEQSFSKQLTNDIINSAALSTGLETVKIITTQLNSVLEALGKPELRVDWQSTTMLFESKNQPKPTATTEAAPSKEGASS